MPGHLGTRLLGWNRSQWYKSGLMGYLRRSPGAGWLWSTQPSPGFGRGPQTVFCVVESSNKCCQQIRNIAPCYFPKNLVWVGAAFIYYLVRFKCLAAVEPSLNIIRVGKLFRLPSFGYRAIKKYHCWGTITGTNTKLRWGRGL